MNLRNATQLSLLTSTLLIAVGCPSADRGETPTTIGRGVKKLSRPLTLGDSCVYVASADTDLGRRGQTGTAANLAQTGHADHFAARHLEFGRRDFGIRLTRH